MPKILLRLFHGNSDGGPVFSNLRVSQHVDDIWTYARVKEQTVWVNLVTTCPKRKHIFTPHIKHSSYRNQYTSVQTVNSRNKHMRIDMWSSISTVTENYTMPYFIIPLHCTINTDSISLSVCHVHELPLQILWHIKFYWHKSAEKSSKE